MKKRLLGASAVSLFLIILLSASIIVFAGQPIVASIVFDGKTVDIGAGTSTW